MDGVEMRLLLGSILSVFLLGINGCSGSTDQPELAQVSGVVTLDGKPVPGLNILFQPEVGRAAVGMTDEEGRYELEYLYGVSGCKMGSNTVGFDWPPDSQNMVAIPASHTGTNAFKFDVKPGSNTFDLTMISDGSGEVLPLVD